MMNKIKNNIAFYAAVLNLVATGFFVNSIVTQTSDPQNVSSAFGMWFAAASVILWVIFVILYVIAPKPSKKNPKKQKR